MLLSFNSLGIATLMYLPFVIIANKAQNEIDRQVESEEETC